MPATKRGIYYNLKESKYTISDNEVVFFFSSLFYMDKFMSGYHTNRILFHRQFNKVAAPNDFNTVMLADIAFYKKCEKRGFRATLKGMEISCQELDQLGLRRMMLTNTNDWHVTLETK